MIDDNADERASSAAPTTAAELPAERKAALLSGRNFWETEAIPELGLPSVVLADGTYGLRHQAGQHDHLALRPPHASLLVSRWARAGTAAWHSGSALHSAVRREHRASTSCSVLE